MNAETSPSEEPKGSLLASVVAGAAGAAVGLSGFEGAIVGGGLAPVLERGIQRFFDRAQRRSHLRVAAAAKVIIDDAATYEAQGERPRSDGFFETSDAEPVPEADSLLEGVLLHAANTYEAPKVAVLGRLYAAVAYDGTVPASEAHFFLKLTDDLTYRQLAGLATLHLRSRHMTHLINAQSDQEVGRAERDPSVLLELDDLHRRGLAAVETRSGITLAAHPEKGMTGVPIANLMLTPIAERFASLARLERIPLADRRRWIAGVGGPASLREPR